MTPEVYEYILDLQSDGKFDINCSFCKNIIYPELIKGVKLYNIFAPGHKALITCKSGKNPHCTCDICY